MHIKYIYMFTLKERKKNIFSKCVFHCYSMHNIRGDTISRDASDSPPFVYSKCISGLAQNWTKIVERLQISYFSTSL